MKYIPRQIEPEIIKNVMSQFSGWLFWDIADLSLDKNRDFIILRVLNDGTDRDLQQLKKLYSENDIINVVKARRGLSIRTALLWANYYQIPYHQCKSLTI